MPHSHRYARRRKLEVMLNGSERIYNYAKELKDEAERQNHHDMVYILDSIMKASEYTIQLLDVLSKPLAGVPLDTITRAKKW